MKETDQRRHQEGDTKWLSYHCPIVSYNIHIANVSGAAELKEIRAGLSDEQMRSQETQRVVRNLEHQMRELLEEMREDQ